MTRRHIAWLIGIFVIGLVLATRNAPLRNAAPPGFELLPSTLPGQPSQIAGAVALPEPKPPAPKIWFSTALEIDRMCHVGNYDCDPGIYLGSETSLFLCIRSRPLWSGHSGDYACKLNLRTCRRGLSPRPKGWGSERRGRSEQAEAATWTLRRVRASLRSHRDCHLVIPAAGAEHQYSLARHGHHLHTKHRAVTLASSTTSGAAGVAFRAGREGEVPRPSLPTSVLRATLRAALRVAHPATDQGRAGRPTRAAGLVAGAGGGSEEK